MSFGYVGSMRVQLGNRDRVVSILVEGANELRFAGCEAYVVCRSDTDEDAIWVFEVWQSKEHHAASLKLPSVQAAIRKAMPMLTGEFTGQELSVIGGLGLGLRGTQPSSE